MKEVQCDKPPTKSSELRINHALFAIIGKRWYGLSSTCCLAIVPAYNLFYLYIAGNKTKNTEPCINLTNILKKSINSHILRKCTKKESPYKSSETIYNFKSRK